jgi:peptidoglycan/LPS O-acetylase OafA/YrhL
LAIFLVYLIAPLLIKIYKKNKSLFILTFIVAIILSVFPVKTDILALSDISKNLVFFLLGILLFDNKDELAKNTIIGIISIIFSTALLLWIIINNRLSSVLLCGTILSLLLAISIKIKESIKENMISKNSMTFYLLHWPFMIATRILLYQIFKIDYIVTAIMMVIAGIVGPTIVIYIINKSKIKNKSIFIKYAIGG